MHGRATICASDVPLKRVKVFPNSHEDAPLEQLFAQAIALGINGTDTVRQLMYKHVVLPLETKG